MKTNTIIRDNEIKANKIGAKILLITFIIMTLVLFLNIIHVFSVPMKVMVVVYIVTTIFTVIPAFIVNILKYEYKWVKYVIIGCTICMIFAATVALRYHAVTAFLLPVIVSTLYLSKRLSIITMSISVIFITLGEYIGYMYNTVPDLNWTNIVWMTVLLIIPRALVFIGMSFMLILLCTRINEILSELMDVNEQKEILERTIRITEKSKEVSKGLVNAMMELKESSDVVSKTNKEIANKTDYVLKGSNENKDNIDSVNNKIININNSIENLKIKSEDVASLSESVRNTVENNQARINKATSSMESINDNVDESMNIITTLGEKSSEIINIVNIITEISSQTNILSLNASIEAARAGESGKGFTIVAEEIGKLASETRVAVENIAKIIEDVVSYTSQAKTAMNMTVNLSKEGLESINEIKEASDNITISNVEMSQKIINIDEITKTITQNSREVVAYMDSLKETNNISYDNINQVALETKESSKASEGLIDIVNKINEMSIALNNVIE